VTSALQRARSTLKAIDVTPGEPFRPSDRAQRELLTRYCKRSSATTSPRSSLSSTRRPRCRCRPSSGGFTAVTRSGRRCWTRTRRVKAHASSRPRRTGRRRSGRCGPAPTASTCPSGWSFSTCSRV
jgi:hypothetical protein